MHSSGDVTDLGNLPDMRAHWLPFTNNTDFKAHPRLFARADGAYYWDLEDRKILDGCSGLFNVAAGHGRKEIADAVHRQLIDLDYAPSFQRSHPSSFAAANAIKRLTPDGLDRIFFCNSGSEAVETAIKIALQYHLARGQGQRTMLVSRERAYHGVNMGGTSLAGLVRNRDAFGLTLPGVVHMRHTWREENLCVMGEGEHGGRELADDLARFVGLYGSDRIAACFVEPIAGSTGVLVPPKGYLQRLKEICTENGILLVFDEVICGFGRTGAAFAADSFGVIPDMIAMAKALTNGAQPMGAVAVSDEIHDTIVEAAGADSIELFHGYTYSAHPAACAAAIATAEIYGREDLFAKAAALSGPFLEGIERLSTLPAVTDVRGYGLLAGLDLRQEDKPGAAGDRLQKRLFDTGLHVKATGDSIILAPPLICSREEIGMIVDILTDTLKAF